MNTIKRFVVPLACCVSAFAQARPQAIRISAGVLHGLVQHAELPKYPEEALLSRTQGDVIFKVAVDKFGKVILSAPVEGHPLLVAASIDALRNFQFQPFLLNGETVQRVESQVGFRFSISGHAERTSGKVEYLSSVPFRPEFRTGVVTDKGVLVLWPRKIAGEEPQLPPDLAGKAASVYLSITIGRDGKVQDVKVLGGDKPFIGPVVAAVKRFVYEPQLVNGERSVVTTEASFHFGQRH